MTNGTSISSLVRSYISSQKIGGEFTIKTITAALLLEGKLPAIRAALNAAIDKGLITLRKAGPDEGFRRQVNMYIVGPPSQEQRMRLQQKAQPDHSRKLMANRCYRIASLMLDLAGEFEAMSVELGGTSKPRSKRHAVTVADLFGMH